MATAVALSGGSTLHGVTDNQKRWLVFGIALNKVLVTQIRSFLEQGIQREYGKLQTSHSIHTQSTSGRLKKWPTFLKYENINGNDALPRLPGGRFADYSLFDCRVTSHVDFARLYVENHMAKFNAFDEHCDASAVLTLLGKVPVFSRAVQSASNDVRQARNAWAHCVFSDWDPVNYQQSFNKMETLVKALGLPPIIERSLLGELNDWESKGTILCMNATVDSDLLNLVQQHVNVLKTDVDQMTLELKEDKERISQVLNDISESLEELEARVASVQHEQEVMKQEQSSISDKVVCLETDMDSTQMELKSLKSQQEDVQQRVTHVEEKLNSAFENRGDCAYKGHVDVVNQQNDSEVSVEIASCESDIAFFSQRRHPDTRQWFFDDFDEWFLDPGDSRAYVLLGDPGVGKSVMAGVMAHRMRKTGHLGAAYFCRHNDNTRNNPRYLLGTVACQLCDCNTQYRVMIGGESGVKMLLGNSKLRVRELFTKLLQEPLSKCSPCVQRKLVIIDALDETEYESREDFLDVIMLCFPLLPEWLVFFITSRPEDSVQFRFKKYNPCVKICAENGGQDNFYQQHEQDIQTFLKNKIDFSRLSVTVEDISKKCNGLFLYAHYIVEQLRLSANSGMALNQLSDLFPGDIDSFFLQNFKRVHYQVGEDIFKKLFGCAIVSPAPLPFSMISYILKRENSNHDEQQVIDAVSQFVVLRTSDQALIFLHNLIPAWLTDKTKARKLFIDKKIAGEYLRTMFVEILSSIVNESRSTCRSIDADLEDYVSCIAVRFLCQDGTKDSLRAVFDCLTSYQFTERRLQSGRIAIYPLLDDLRLAVDHLPWKQEILQEILYAIESNVLVLSEWPHLLHSCIRKASNAVRETMSFSQVSSPWLESMLVYSCPAGMQCFATSPDGKKVVGAKGRCLLFFDASTAERTSGPFEVSKNTIDNIEHLEFSPDGKFLFFGRLDKWFSVKQSCVEVFPQFSENSHIYKWGLFTPDGNCILVKRSFLSTPGTCSSNFCLSNLLALWASKEIDQSRDDAMTGSFDPQERCSWSGRYFNRLYNRLGIAVDFVPESCFHPTCCYCHRLNEFYKSVKEPSLATIRQLVIELYPFIFDYQAWDLKTGMPALQQYFTQSIQLHPITDLCHVARLSFGECGLKMGFSGSFRHALQLDLKLLSALDFDSELDLLYVSKLDKKSLSESLSKLKQLKEEWSELLSLVEKLKGQLKVFRDLTQELRQEQRLVLKLQLEQEEKFLERVRVPETLTCQFPLRHWIQLSEWRKERLLSEVHSFRREINQERKGQRIMSAMFKEFYNEALTFGVHTSIDKGFQTYVYDVNEKIRVCASPEKKWIEVSDLLRMRLLRTGNQDQRFDHYLNPEHIISKFTHFTLTNDGLYCVYSCGCSLHALSLQTGTEFTSLSGCNVIYFTKERQFGYLFRSETEEKNILLTSLFSPFKFLAESPVRPSDVGKSIGAIFHSSNKVLSVSLDSNITFWETMANKEYIALISKSSLTASLPLKNCVLSSDGGLIAIHQETKIELYSFADNGGEKKFLYSVYESKCEFTVACFAFSADSTLLLFCIQDSGPCPHFHVWDVQQKVIEATVKSSGLLTIECCCFSSDNSHVILCGDYEIEIWEYAKDTCRRLGIERPYHSVKFGQCTVSLDNQLLVCCIANTILIYNLLAPNINSSKQCLRGHLGRIGFCRFLKANRHLISYAVDGMVFLWDMMEFKAVAFARITQGNEKIVAMAVSPEEDIAICFTSSDRICMIKLCGLGAAPSLKPLISPSKGRLETAESSLRVRRQMASTPTEDDMADSSSSSDSQEDINDYYHEHDDDVYLM